MRLLFVLNLLLLLVSSLFHKAWAQVVAPSKGGDVSIVQVTATSMELRVGTTGTGQGRIVAIAPTKAGRSIPLAPVDNQFYTGSSTYGQGSSLGTGFVVYNGSGHTVSVTGLQPNTYYYISTAEYNTDNMLVAYNIQSTNMIMPTRKEAMVSPAPLPVQLVVFSGIVDAHSIATLSWTTASEYNSAYFAIERSVDGASFTQVGQLAGAGSSNRSLSYQWLDAQPLAATTYYRLRQVDRDATIRYSSVITLQPAIPVAKSVEVYPNPGTTQSMQVAIQGYNGETFALQLTDALGRQVFSTVVNLAEGSYQAPLGLPATLTAGTYLCTLRGSTVVLHKRIEVRD